MHYMQTDSPLGKLTLASDGNALVGLWLEGQKYYPDLSEAEKKDDPILASTREWLKTYFAGEDPREDLPLSPKGTPFQLEVWGILQTIPRGTVMTYGEIAKILTEKTGKRACAQAVGGAVGRNPVSIIIPCHRVVGSDGSLTGYAGGVRRKKQLLILEHAWNESFHIPKKGSAL